MYRAHEQIGLRQRTFHPDLMQSNFAEKSWRRISLMKPGGYQLARYGGCRSVSGGSPVDPNFAMLAHTPRQSNLESPGH
jgi:hypothetical protein